MGTITHHSIIVTGFQDGRGSIHEARQAAIDAGCAVTDVVEHGINFTASFLVVPDGSKEGWDASDKGDRARDAFIKWLEEDNGYNSWVEVSSGEQTPTHKVCRGSA